MEVRAYVNKEDIFLNEISIQKKIRFVELVLIISVAILPFFLRNLFIHLNLYSINTSINVRFFIDGIDKITYVALLLYILFRQGRSIRDIGVSFSGRDIFRGILIYIIVMIIIVIYQFISVHASILITGKPLTTNPQHTDILVGKITIIYILAMIINPFFEELILRAYLMCEIEFLSNSKFIAVIVSVLIQTSAHIYEGYYSMSILALVFLIFSIYFAKNKRIMPIIIAHAIMDIVSMLSSGKF